MKIKSPIIAYEFSTLYIEGEYHKEDDIALSKITFDNLWNFILSSKANNDSDIIMSVHTRNGKRHIKTGRYVGTLQTRDGQTIEILPKIYKASGKQESDQRICRKVFLNMLRHFTEAKAHSFQQASLNTVQNFPILEVYIYNYITAVEELIICGIKKNYSNVSENQKFLKGKLNFSEQIKRNLFNKANFSVVYNKYIDDIPQNRIIVTTLRKLMHDTHNTVNKSHITSLLNILSDIPSSKNIEHDLTQALNGNRLFSSYQLLLQWSSQFLINRGFTTFSGSNVNQSLLFQAEKLFEDFIAYLFKRYAPTYNVNPQHTQYFLVDRHGRNGMFRLRPDIFIETDPSKTNYECIIIDTKWKALDETKPDKHYLIDIKDMYQLFAYGQKYKQGQTEEVGLTVEPRLVLIYPYSEKFKTKLPEFIYEEIRSDIGLKLSVVPFDLTEPNTYERQIHNIIHNLQPKQIEASTKQYVYSTTDDTIPQIIEDKINPYGRKRPLLIGCYKSEEHHNWIISNKLYNVRIGAREGAIDKSQIIIAASRLLLYNFMNPNEYYVYDLDPTQQIFASYEKMQSLSYPGLQKNNEYLLYVLRNRITKHPHYTVAELKETYASCDIANGAPFYAEY